MSQLTEHLAGVLHRDASSIAARWREQAPNVAPRALAAPADAERVMQGAMIIRSISDVLRNDPRSHASMMRDGWELGAASYTAGLSLHYMLKEIDLLSAMTLYACECALATPLPAVTTAPAPTAGDGLTVARQLNRGFSLLTIAAAKGFTDTYLTGLRAEYRTIRHDLRNPLGTITGAVSLMSDDSVTPERRNDPRFRAMVERNASSMNALIGARLSDASAQVPAFARQEVSLRDIALTVRRDLREAAAAAGCAIEVSDFLPTVHTDSTAFELALRCVVTAALLSARPGSAIHIGPATLGDESVQVPVAFERPPDRLGYDDVDHRFDFARDLTRRAGGTVHLADPVCLEMPISPSPAILTAHASDDRPGGH